MLYPQSVKDDAIDCIRRPLQHRDRAHVQFQARTGCTGKRNYFLLNITQF